MLKTMSAVTGALVWLASSLAQAQTYDAAKDFSVTNNPNGAWSYLSGTGSTAAPLAKKGTGPLERNAGAVSFWNTGASGFNAYHGVFANQTSAPVMVSAGLEVRPGTLVLHPADKGGPPAMVRFVAPSAGEYAVDATFTTLDAQAKKTDVTVRVNGGEVLKQGLQGANAKASYRGTAKLEAGQAVEFVVGNGGDGFADDAVGLTATLTRSEAAKFSGWYRLKTKFQGDKKCLEGNEAGSPVKGGAAFMDDCKNVTGQSWQLVPEGEHYRLKTKFQGDKKCLEGNEAGSPVKQGAAFMDDCKNVTGQLWQVVPEGQYYRLKTKFQGDKKCLEGNEAGSPVKQGAAFMDDCKGVSGQLWQLVAEGG